MANERNRRARIELRRARLLRRLLPELVDARGRTRGIALLADLPFELGRFRGGQRGARIERARQTVFGDRARQLILGFEISRALEMFGRTVALRPI